MLDVSAVSVWDLPNSISAPIIEDDKRFSSVESNLDLLTAKTGIFDLELYRLTRVVFAGKSGSRVYRTVYVLDGIKDSALEHYLDEPGMIDLLKKMNA